MRLRTTISMERAHRIESDVLVVPWEGKKIATDDMPAGLQESLRKLARGKDFTGAWATGAVMADSTSARALLVAFVGLGDGEGLEKRAEALRRGIGQIVRDTAGFRPASVTLDLHGCDDAPALAAAATDGAYLADYRFSDFSQRLKKLDRKSLKKLTVAVDVEAQRETRAAVKDAQTVLAGVRRTRDLVNRPAGHLSPQTLVDMARDITSASPTLALRVLNRAQAAKAGFSAFLAVARGSTEEPYVIHMTYRPPTRKEGRKKVWLVGKGITFDSGGLSLKPSEAMETMKIDMAGAATVLGVFSVITKLGLDVEVHGVIAACENMPSGSAYRPGDVVTAKNGTTIEVLNTDAEGRVTLADVLAYGVEEGADAIVDLATLTGACVVALGETVAGLWGNDDDLIKRLASSARAHGEQLEPMPMPPEYRSQIESTVADVRNTSTSRYGGAITAALFLKEFVGDTSWAHIDLAGPSYMEHAHIPYWGHGATGYGVRTLVEFLRSYNEQE